MATDYTAQFSDFSNMPQYDLARQKAAQQAAADKQNNLDTLQRRFANLGNLNSGAQIKQEENLSNDSAKSLSDANEGINAQQQAEILRRQEVLQGQQFQGEQLGKQQAFQTSERLGAQEFAGGELGKQEAFTTSERLGGQEFASGERAAGQEFTKGQNLANMSFQGHQNDLQRTQQAKQFSQTFALSSEQMRQAQDQFNQTFGEEVRVDTKNMDFAQQALDKKGWLDGIMGGGGSSLSTIFGPLEGQMGGGLSSSLKPNYLGPAAPYISGVSNQVSSWI